MVRREAAVKEAPKGHRESARSVLDGRVSRGQETKGRRPAIRGCARRRTQREFTAQPRPSPAVFQMQPVYRSTTIRLPCAAGIAVADACHSMIPPRANVRPAPCPDPGLNRYASRPKSCAQRGLEAVLMRGRDHEAHVGREYGHDPRCNCRPHPPQFDAEIVPLA